MLLVLGLGQLSFRKSWRKIGNYPRAKLSLLFALGFKIAYMNELTPEQLDQYIKENLKVKKRIILSITINGKEYTEPVLVEQFYSKSMKELPKESKYSLLNFPRMV